MITQRNALYLLFTLSGFSGLIYESIWSHYLKLFLGHAAYAQTVVLATFMGGMALGSWVSSRWSARWPNLLLGYALAEGAIGLCGIVFHQAFVALTEFSYDAVIPALGSAGAATLFKWSVSALLILPQSVLLGMTFPLVAAGMIRLFPERSGGTLAMLYFTNSLGASVGVLASGFFLIERVGLPGTILSAGLINIALALVVWLLAGKRPAPAAPAAARGAGASADRGAGLYLAVALLTGAASFIYEIGWLRMLAMVLGSSSHAFELMLSAFILGLALGGLWIRGRIDAIARPERFLGIVQVVMGLLALATLPLYDQTFHVMTWLLQVLTRTDAGYTLFNVASHLISLGVMLPAAFCAGTTLPLITHCLLRSGSGERAIGAVYAANTVGAILGVVAAVHVGMPGLGLKGLMSFGAALDVALGLLLLWRLAGPRWEPALASAIGVGAIGATLALVQLDPYKMASGVYRTGTLFEPGSARIEYHGDGKTSSVSLVRVGDRLSLHTNGKPDASLNVSGKGPPRPDELAQILSAVLPLAAHPRPRTAANIGFGSGATSHVLLSSSALREVDSIEIEPFVVRAARGFMPRNALAYTDPRSRIYYEDAKTFFSIFDKRYDIIVSEPSNPWVSGTASLFTEEFYARVRRHLNAGGVFAQWLQMYEINPGLVASILKALARHFPDYTVYAATDIDFVVLARREGRAELAPERVLAEPRLARELERVAIRTPADLALHRLATRAALQPYFNSLPVPANSDYFPYLEFHAPRARFVKEWVGLALDHAIAPIPALEMLSAAPAVEGHTTPGSRSWLRKSLQRQVAQSLTGYLLTGQPAEIGGATEDLRAQARLARLLLLECARPELLAQAHETAFVLAKVVIPVLGPGELRPLWRRVLEAPCAGRHSEGARAWIELYAALSDRDAPAMVRRAEALLASRAEGDAERVAYLLAAAVTGRLAQGDREGALRAWTDHSGRLPPRLGFQLEFLAGYLAGK